MAKDIEILNTLDRVKEVVSYHSNFDVMRGELHLDLKPYTDFFQISDDQAIILCACIHISINRNETIGIKGLSRFFEVPITTIARKMDDISVLVEKYLLSEIKSDNRRSSSLPSYEVRSEIIEAVLKHDFEILNINMVFNDVEFFEYTSDIIYRKAERKIRSSELRLRFDELLKVNEKLEFVKSLNSYKLNARDRFIVAIIASLHIEGESDMDINRIYRLIFDSRKEYTDLHRDIQSGKSSLIRKKIIEITPGMFTNDEVQFTKEAVSKLFDGQSVVSNEESTKMVGYSYKEIGEQKLFYPKSVKDEVKKIKALFSEKNYNRAKRITEQNKMSFGINILFYGPPGTGKTELVYQLARHSKRAVIPVSISETKSKWFGESEQLIKQLFDDYHKVMDESDRVPILLFNEADAIFSSRMTNGTSTVDQTRNAIQNILLQELEDFKGILIATTNLTDNFDKAFDRRFLFKVNIGMPDAESSFNIWKTMLPKVKKSFLKEASNSFVLSGGQIENIARQIFINEVLGVKEVTREVLLSLCNQELSLSQKQQRTSIGFINHKQAV